MKKLDPGLSAIGLLVLFAALACMLAVSLPLVKSDPSVHTSDWLGFSGSIIGALIALTAAMIAIKPVKSQLAEMTRQNDHVSHERLCDRAAKLTNELSLITTVAAKIDVVQIAMADVNVDAVDKTVAFAAYEQACDELNDCVKDLQVARGFVWGMSQQQANRDHFIDTCLTVSSASMRYATKVRMQTRLASIIAKNEVADFEKCRGRVWQGIPKIHSDLQIALARTRSFISRLEERLFDE
ncbi:hypothetical protein BN961_00571 [Afipia felis]|uniref:Uncharacterized protein n=1 Tax=Afipia felis TaxID=1035 RepID=A0A090N6P0_AFIFE|nr:hypothetical protein [Afipia felis]CEG07188.1 hypothetical protein BN961_00571 [Afipia felis]